MLLWFKGLLKEFSIEVGSDLRNLHKFIHTNREDINAYLTILFLTVTIIGIIVTVQSTSVSRQIGEIEVYLAGEAQKDKIVEQRTLAEDLLSEISDNNRHLVNEYAQIESLRNATDFMQDFLKTTKIEQARNEKEFGSPNMREKFSGYFDLIRLLKDDLQEIQKTSGNGDYKIKNERITHFSTVKKTLFTEFKVDEFMKDIEDYIKLKDAEYEKVKTSTDNELSALLKMN